MAAPRMATAARAAVMATAEAAERSAAVGMAARAAVIATAEAARTLNSRRGGPLW